MNILIQKFKEKHKEDIKEMKIKIYDTELIGYKSFKGNGQSILFNHITSFYECWDNNSKLVTDEIEKVKDFLKL